MADRLTQLQESVNIMADHFCNAVGYLQQVAPPSQFPGFGQSPAPKPADITSCEEYALHFAQIISRTAKDIDLLVDSLPNEDSSPELQAACLRRLEQQNEEAAQRLEKAVRESEVLLSQVQSSLHEIAQVQLQCQALESDFS